jgi:hypothetical protein
MAESEKKTTTPTKPRKTAAKKTAVIADAPRATTNVTEMPRATNGAIHAEAPKTGVPYEQVALLAHRFWAERGHQHGHHVEDWLRAEHELRGKAS